jgi:hypothetical protein
MYTYVHAYTRRIKREQGISAAGKCELSGAWESGKQHSCKCAHGKGTVLYWLPVAKQGWQKQRFFLQKPGRQVFQVFAKDSFFDRKNALNFDFSFTSLRHV